MPKTVYFNEPNEKIFSDEMIYPSICHGYKIERDQPSDFSQTDYLVSNEANLEILSAISLIPFGP